MSHLPKRYANCVENVAICLYDDVGIWVFVTVEMDSLTSLFSGETRHTSRRRTIRSLLLSPISFGPELSSLLRICMNI